jgi:acetate kinase
VFFGKKRKILIKEAGEGRKEVKMKILVVNCGSSTLKFQLIDSETEEVSASGLCERIGLGGSITYKKEGEKYQEEVPFPDHGVAIQKVLDTLLDGEIGVLKSLSEINAIGHRLVHGGEKFASSVVIDEEVIKAIESCNDLAPLHNPANLLGVRACQKVMPGIPNVAVFDTAFHQTMPPKAYLYGLPKEYYKKYGVRRYGFHGTSHSFVSHRLAELAGLDIGNSKMIVCHIGSGASISAIKNGESIDTSMGMTPLEGLLMGTRSGDIDPAIIEFICSKEGISVGEMTDILNKKSGALGVSGVSSDFRDLIEEMENGNEDAKNAVDIMIYRIIKYIGAYFVALDGADAIALTAGIGENNAMVRERIMKGLAAIGVVPDLEANAESGREHILTKPESKVAVWVIPTNEELAIARETVRLVKK